MTGERLLDSLLEAAEAKLDRTNSAYRNVAKAVELELAEIKLSEEDIDEKTRERLLSIGRGLVESASLHLELIRDIKPLVGEILSLNGQQITLDESSQAVESLALPENPDKSSVISPIVPTEGRKPTGESLYDEIVPSNFIRNPDSDNTGEAPVVGIVNGKSIKINDRVVELTKNERYILNTLLMNRHEPKNSSWLMAYGFKSGPAAFSQSLGPLIQKLDRKSGKIIIRENRGRAGSFYIINPRIYITDERQEEAVQPNDVKKNP